MSSIISGVIAPLTAETEEVKISLEIKAFSASGINPTTLETKVKETLQQIGAEIEKWQEE